MTWFISSGDGPSIVCLHGIGGSSSSFDGIRGELDEQFTVVAWDAPGYGDSPDPKGPPGLAGYVERVRSLVWSIGDEPVVLLGMSWGGVIAMQLALSHPGLVRGLILGDSTRGSGQTPQQAEKMLARSRELTAVGPVEFAARRARQLLAPGTDTRQVDAVARAMGRAIRMPGYGYAAAAMSETDLSSRLSDISVPTLVVYGREDRITGEPESAALAQGIPGAQLVAIDNAGHVSNQERPGEFAEIVRRFVSGL